MKHPAVQPHWLAPISGRKRSGKWPSLLHPRRHAIAYWPSRESHTSSKWLPAHLSKGPAFWATSAADESASRSRLGGSVPAESNRRRQIVFRKSKKIVSAVPLHCYGSQPQPTTAPPQDLADPAAERQLAPFSPGGERPGDPINGTGRSMCCTGSKVVKETGKRQQLWSPRRIWTPF